MSYMRNTLTFTFEKVNDPVLLKMLESLDNSDTHYALHSWPHRERARRVELVVNGATIAVREQLAKLSGETANA